MKAVQLLCLSDECQGWTVRTRLRQMVRLPATLVRHARRLVARVEVAAGGLGWWQAWETWWWTGARASHGKKLVLCPHPAQHRPELPEGRCFARQRLSNRCVMRELTPLPQMVSSLLGLLWLALSQTTLAQQRPQDNWHLEQTWVKTNATLNATNGGLSSPYGVAIGLDGRVYVGDEGYGCIQVYLPDGTYSFSITNGFGGGLSFSQPRGMITDKGGNLYVADLGTNCVFMFSSDGTFIRKFGSGTGSGDGQLNGVIDVAVSAAGEVYVLETGNCPSHWDCNGNTITFPVIGNARVSVFDNNGAFLKTLLGPGSLDGQLQSPASIAISASGRLFISQNYTTVFGLCGYYNFFMIKVFDLNGVFSYKFSQTSIIGNSLFGPSSVRVDRSGLLHVILGMSGGKTDCMGCGTALAMLPDDSIVWNVFDLDGLLIAANTVGFGGLSDARWPCHDIGPDGSVIICNNPTKKLNLYRYAMRELWRSPRNAIPMPRVADIQQRPNSPLVDIDYQVTDADDTNVYAAMLVFKNGVQSLSNCIANLTCVEGTATNLGSSIAANQPHRVTWNAGADWGVNLGDYRVAVLARDSRPGLLDIHYISLPGDRGMPALRISRSPLTTNDFMQVWWWLLATHDPGISLSSNRIYGVSAPNAAKVLCDDGDTTGEGRSYLFAKMQVREATPEEVDWARHGSTATTVNQWPPTRVVGGRPEAVNEYGFDTGNWDTNTCRWVVPLN